jgi:protease-4
MQRYGVVDQTMTSGPFKDTGSPFRPMREDERAYLQGVVTQLFDRFRSVVLAGRPNLSEAQVRRLADGRIFTADQAKELGLIDRVGHFEDAVAALETRAGVQKTRVVMYQRPESYRNNPYIRSPTAPPGAGLEWLDLRRWLPPAGFYYMWPPALPEFRRP